MTLKLLGSSSGHTAIDAPAAAGSNTIVLPANNGSANQALVNSSTAGTLEYKPYYGPAFRAYLNTNPTVASGSDFTIPFGAETFDTDNCFNTSNYRFTPNLAGYYHVNATVVWNPTNNIGSGWDAISILRKSGSEISRCAIFLDAQDWLTNVNADLVYLNGSSDYLDVYVWHNRGGNEYLTQTRTNFSAHWVRP